MSEVRMEVRGIDVARGSNPVLTGIDLELRRGEVLSLIGPNGAGKTTLLHTLAGDVKPSRGTIELDGRALHSYRSAELARIRAVLTQSNEVSFPFTVRQVVEMGRAPWRDTVDASGIIDRAIADAELEALADRRVNQLSGGERARAAYARIRAQQCDIILLDEPTASLDIRHQERLLQQLRRHVEAGGSAVIVVHDLDLAAAYADRVAVLDGGRLRAVGTPAEALSEQLLSEVYRHPIRIHDLGPDSVIRPVRSATHGDASPAPEGRPLHV
jgi:iron complex transport system ATP-binding protein